MDKGEQMKQNEDLTVALVNLILLENCMSDKNGAVAEMVRNIKEKLIKLSDDIDVAYVQQTAELIEAANKALECGNNKVAWGLFDKACA